MVFIPPLEYLAQVRVCSFSTILLSKQLWFASVLPHFFPHGVPFRLVGVPMLRFAACEDSLNDLSASWWGGNADHIAVSHHLARNPISSMLAIILLISQLHAWLCLPVEHMGAIGAAIQPPPLFPLTEIYKTTSYRTSCMCQRLRLIICVLRQNPIDSGGESSIVLSAAWRLPWPGGGDTSQRSNAVQWTRCVGSAVGRRFSANTGKILWLINQCHSILSYRNALLWKSAIFVTIWCDSFSRRPEVCV